MERKKKIIRNKNPEFVRVSELEEGKRQAKNRDKDLVTAIITTHDRYVLLLKAIDSVLAQTYKEIELIVVDDASDENKEEEIRNLYQNRVKYIRIEKKDSKGGNHARNVGIQHAKGKYIAFLDDDDMWLPRKTEKQVEYLKQHSECGMMYCNVIYFNEKGERKENPNLDNQGDCSKKCLYNILCVTSSIMCTKEILNSVGGFDENLRFWQETDLVIRMAQVTKIGYINEWLVRYFADEKSPNRLTNKYYEWWSAVEYHNVKHAELIEKLSDHEKKLRWLLIYKDAEHRTRGIKDTKEKQRIRKRIFELQPNIKNLIKYVLGFTPDQGEFVRRLVNKLRQN